ncbi:MAG TPA: hypothetical protein DIW67_18890 [Pseudomonas sp.]|nr:hypothetical protein [Pseudomonas sp.]
MIRRKKRSLLALRHWREAIYPVPGQLPAFLMIAGPMTARDDDPVCNKTALMAKLWHFPVFS